MSEWIAAIETLLVSSQIVLVFVVRGLGGRGVLCGFGVGTAAGGSRFAFLLTAVCNGWVDPSRARGVGEAAPRTAPPTPTRRRHPRRSRQPTKDCPWKTSH